MTSAAEAIHLIMRPPRWNTEEPLSERVKLWQRLPRSLFQDRVSPLEAYHRQRAAMWSEAETWVAPFR